MTVPISAPPSRQPSPFILTFNYFYLMTVGIFNYVQLQTEMGWCGLISPANQTCGWLFRALTFGGADRHMFPQKYLK